MTGPIVHQVITVESIVQGTSQILYNIMSSGAPKELQIKLSSAAQESLAMGSC